MQTVSTLPRRVAMGQLVLTGALAGAGGIAASSVGLGAIAPKLAPATVDPHIAWGAEWFALLDVWNIGGGGLDTDSNATWSRIEQLGRLIVDMPATTLAGALVQVDAALEWLGANDPGVDTDCQHEVRALRHVRVVLAHHLGDAGSITAGPALAAADTDPHVKWERQVQALRLATAGKESGPLDDEMCAVEERIGETSAKTMAGVMVQLRMARLGVTDEAWCQVCETALVNAVASLERLGGRA